MKSTPFSKERAADVADVLRALAHPVRLRIIDILCENEKCVGELAEMVEKPQAIVSQQLKILRMGGLVKPDRRSGRAYYSLNNPHLHDLLVCVKNCACNEESSRRE